MRFFVSLISFVFLASNALGQDVQYTKNANGDEFVLYSDGIWSYRKDLNYTKIQPRLLANPSFTGYTVDSGKTVAPVKLKQVFSELNNDYKPDAWLKRNNLNLPSTVYHMSKMNYQYVPHKISTKYESSIISQRFVDSNYTYVVYEGTHNSGRYLVILNPELDSVVAALDFYYYQKAPVSRRYGQTGFDFTQQGLAWLSCVNDTLYFSTHHRTYSDSSEGMNAYVTCYDLKTQEVIWRSDPLISNVSSFAVHGDYIFTGYGFTEEDDFLYVLNRYTGKVVLQHKISKAPRYIVEKDNQLFVRTYNRNYVFDIISEE